MRPAFFLSAAATVLLAASSSFAQNEGAEGQGQAVVTVVPSSHSNEKTVQVSQQDIRELKVDGKPAQVTAWAPLRNDPVELVLLMDSGARASLGTQMGEISSFVQELPPHTRMTIAFMQNGRAVLAGPLSSDPSEIISGLHLPAGPGGISASPYFCLSDLARNWPSQNRSARREVVMVTDGIDDYNPHYDPDDPYVQAAITDSVRSGLVIYALYWRDADRLSRMGWAQDAGQNLLLQVADATGGASYWEGFGDPVSFQPYFQDLRRRLTNQYELSFTAPMGKKPGVESLNLKFAVPGAKVDAPREVYIQPATQAGR